MSSCARRRRSVIGVLVCLGIAGGEPARALDSCTLASVDALAFGSYDALAGVAVDTTGGITYHCTGTPETIAISIDGGANGYGPRQMNSGAHTLEYDVYLDAGRSTVWGDGSSGTSVWQGTAVVDEDTLISVFARIFAWQNAHVGSYGDTLVVTITY